MDGGVNYNMKNRVAPRAQLTDRAKRRENMATMVNGFLKTHRRELLARMRTEGTGQVAACVRAEFAAGQEDLDAALQMERDEMILEALRELAAAEELYEQHLCAQQEEIDSYAAWAYE